MVETMSGVDLIAAERRRQIEVEGYDADHDDNHSGGAILSVAGEIVSYVDPRVTLDLSDPWGIIKRTERKYPDPDKCDIRLLTIAGALIAAEIDRLARTPNTPGGEEHG